MYQLAARMSAAVPSSPFQNILQEVPVFFFFFKWGCEVIFVPDKISHFCCTPWIVHHSDDISFPQKLICRVSIDHSHHCLYVVLALGNATKDEAFSPEHTTGSKPSARTNARLSKAKSTHHATVDEVSVEGCVVCNRCKEQGEREEE